MTENGTFIINGTERVVVSQLHRSPGRLLRSRQGQDPLVGQAALHARASSRTAARGSTSSSTTRTSSTSASTAAASCTRRCCCARSATRREELLNYFYDDRDDLPRGEQEVREVGRATSCSPASARRATSSTRSRARSSSRRTASSPRPAIKKLQEAKIDTPAGRRRGARRQGRRRTTSSTRTTGEVLLECQRGGDRGQARRAPRSAASSSSRSSSSTASTSARYLRDTLLADKVADARRGDHRDLPPPAPGRSADARDGEDALPQPVLQPRALRPLEGRPPQAELQVQDRRAARELRSSPSATSSRRFATSSS